MSEPWVILVSVPCFDTWNGTPNGRWCAGEGPYGLRSVGAFLVPEIARPAMSERACGSLNWCHAPHPALAWFCAVCCGRERGDTRPVAAGRRDADGRAAGEVWAAAGGVGAGGTGRDHRGGVTKPRTMAGDRKSTRLNSSHVETSYAV